MSNYARMMLGRKRSILAVLVSAGILVLLAFKIELRLTRVVEELRSARWGVLLAAFVFSGAWHVFLGADKWWRILRRLGADVTYGEVLRVRLGSDPIRFASPFKVGEIVNAVYFSRPDSLGFSRAAGSIAFDKALNFFGTLVWLYVGIVSMTRIPPAGHIVLHTAVGVGILLVVGLRPLRELVRQITVRAHPKVGRLAAGILAAFEEFPLRRKLGFLLYGTVFQLRPLIVCYLLFAAFRPERMPSLQEFLAFGSVAVLMSNVPLTVAGIGPREAAIIALFSPYASQTTLLSVGILMSFSIHVIPAMVGIPFMFLLLRAIASSSAIGSTGRSTTVREPVASAVPARAVSAEPAAGTEEE